LIGQTWWIASKIGGIEAEVVSTERRLVVVEQTGSPALQGIRTETAINGRRIDSIEAAIGNKLSDLTIITAGIQARQSDVLQEVLRLRDWRAVTSTVIGENSVKITAMQSELDRIRHAIAGHAADDQANALRQAALEGRMTASEKSK
jgi:hypothetical protein